MLKTRISNCFAISALAIGTCMASIAVPTSANATVINESGGTFDRIDAFTDNGATIPGISNTAGWANSLLADTWASISGSVLSNVTFTVNPVSGGSPFGLWLFAFNGSSIIDSALFPYNGSGVLQTGGIVDPINDPAGKYAQLVSDATPIPESSSLSLFVLALIGIGFARYRRQLLASADSLANGMRRLVPVRRA